MRRSRGSVVTLVVVLAATAAAVALPGCAKDRGDEARPRRTTTTAPDPRRTTTTVSDLPSADLSVSKVLASDLQFATFAKVVARSGLAGRLDGLDAVMVLAPNERAMDALDPVVRRAVLRRPAAAREFVERHTVGRRLSLTDLLNRPGPLRTLDGSTVTVSFDPVAGKGDSGTPLTVGGARHTLLEVPARNGFVEVLAGVVGSGR